MGTLCLQLSCTDITSPLTAQTNTRELEPPIYNPGLGPAWKQGEEQLTGTRSKMEQLPREGGVGTEREEKEGER